MHAELRTLLSLTTECATPDEYEQARAQWLERVVGFDALYLGAAFPEAKCAHVTAGVDQASVEACEANAQRYWPDRVELNREVLARGGVAVDYEVLSARRRREMPLYDEIMSGIGVRCLAAAVLRVRGRPLAALYLGRTLHRPFEEKLELLADALPILALGTELHAGRTSPSPRDPHPDRFSRREREIIEYIRLGLTNAQIATAIGTSPHTVKNQIATLLRKAEVANRTELAAAFRPS